MSRKREKRRQIGQDACEPATRFWGISPVTQERETTADWQDSCEPATNFWGINGDQKVREGGRIVKAYVKAYVNLGITILQALSIMLGLNATYRMSLELKVIEQES